MVDNFFDTNEYKILQKIQDRLKEFCSLKNMCLYVKYASICIKLCQSDYNDVGFCDNAKTYKWLPLLGDDIFEQYTNEEAKGLIDEFSDDFDGIIKKLDRK